jgi:ubiquinone/menaquinone biosynthesis C-methylase UbiE
MPTSIEQKYVLDTYSHIADEFSTSRYSVWKFVKEFLQDKEKLWGLDIGCGNGKNMIYDNMVGMDNNETFIKICKSRGKEVVLADCTNIPFDDNTFDYVVCVSVIHHLSTDERRVQCVNEMKRVLKVGCSGMFNVWSEENQDKQVFVDGDNYVPWKSRTQKMTQLRYYNIMNHDRFMKLVNRFTDDILVTDVKNEKGNWIVEFIKK